MTRTETMITWQNLHPLLTLVVLTASCATEPVRPTGDRTILENMAACEDVAQPSGQQNVIYGELDANNLTVLNWNIQKAYSPELKSDLASLRATADLMLLQEAVLNDELQTLLGSESHHAFAPGYNSFGKQSGVVTASNIAPAFKCALSHREPWLRSPKATSITRYAIKDSQQSLLVINTHVVNFALGTSAINKQLNTALEMIELHDGPVIVSGDFNTWSKARGAWLDERLRAKDLSPVAFVDDHRKRFLGNALDHIYVRNLRPLTSTTLQSEYSDHNPMLVSLELE